MRIPRGFRTSIFIPLKNRVYTLLAKESTQLYMDAESVHVVFKVVRQCNKTQYDTCTRQNMPMFESVTALRHFLVDDFKAEFAPAGHAESFRLGYIAGRNRS